MGKQWLGIEISMRERIEMGKKDTDGGGDGDGYKRWIRT